MSPGSSTESYPAFARIGLRENPGKNLNQVTCPDRDSNPGHLVSQPDALTVTPQFYPWLSIAEGRVVLILPVNCPKTGLDPTSDSDKASLMRQLGQEIMEWVASFFPHPYCSK
ncbi:hypothetical protein ANN_14323 [Periplaneta americana]|uniref:Uncharacterized protein n=1 Tax=Periplaneta americana TaxID=6978 RepID=A0ABQ8SX77_PERAM|nr:hypothetical protein ANN_14323 [Periplaneta americana]